MRRKASNSKTMKEGKTIIKFKQISRARVGQGGNAFSINASEAAVVRVRP